MPWSSAAKKVYFRRAIDEGLVQYQTDVRNIGLTCIIQYVANMTACLILVKYSFNIARYIVPTSKEISLTNLGTIFGWYSHHINWLNIWNTPLSDIFMMSEYNRYIILANICAMFHIGSILYQYGCATRVSEMIVRLLYREKQNLAFNTIFHS